MNKYMSKKYYGTILGDTFCEWSLKHKTVIVLNGGFSSNLLKLEQELGLNHPYPFASFCEGMDELNGAMTVVGIVLPEKVYSSFNVGLPAGFKSGTIGFHGGETLLSEDDVRIINIMKNYKLA
jgi:hypothetical protein